MTYFFQLDLTCASVRPLKRSAVVIIPVLTLMPFTFCGNLLGPLCNPPASALPLFLTSKRPPSPFFHHRSAYTLYNFMSVETCSNWSFPGLFHSVVYGEAYPVILHADSHLFAVSESIPRHRHTAIHYALLMATGVLSFVFVLLISGDEALTQGFRHTGHTLSH